MQITNWGIGFHNTKLRIGLKMELSPKQQAVNEIKNAKRILLLGHKKTDGDHLGSLLALKIALEKLEKSVECIVSDKIDGIYRFLPKLDEVKTDYKHTKGKILRIDTNRIPVAGMKWQKEDDFLNIYLDTDKNLKFEFIEIINGLPKPDLIIIVDTPDVEKIDMVYDKNTELFFEVPILNIDHHPGNEYFGTINLIDLTATSTAEILVSLFEALGIKIDNADMATCLLAGILHDTQSFRGESTTPKSLTVAAQLLAAGGRQQEIIKNFYQKKPVELLKTWGEMLANTQLDEALKFAWTKIDTSHDSTIVKDDVFGAADDLLVNTPGAEIVLILFRGADNPAITSAKIKGSNNKEVLSIAKLFGGSGTSFSATFEVKEANINNAEKIILKRIAETKAGSGVTNQELWDVIETSPNIEKHKKTYIKPNEETPDAEEQPPILARESTVITVDIPNSQREKEDAIEEALKSISQIEQDENRKEFVSLRDVIDRKKNDLPETTNYEQSDVDLDIFDEE